MVVNPIAIRHLDHVMNRRAQKNDIAKVAANPTKNFFPANIRPD